MKITVQEHQTSTPYKGSRTVAKARLYASDTFTAEDGSSIVGGNIRNGNWYLEVDAEADEDGFVTIGAFSGDNKVETTNNDSVDNGVTYTLALYDSNGKHIQTLFENLRVFDTLSTTSWDALNLASNLRTHNYSVEVASRSWVQSLYGALVSMAQKATSVVIGAVKLTATPDDLTQPTAVSASDTVYRSALQSRYLRDYDDLEDAIDSLAATNSELIIDEPTAFTFGSNTVIPATTRVKFVGTGSLDIQGSRTLTIHNLDNPGNRKVFTGENIRISQKAAGHINLAWWGGTDESADMTVAITQCLDNLGASGGGIWLIPQGVWKTTGGHSAIPSFTTIIGNASNSYGTGGTVIQLTDDADHIFKIEEAFRDITIKDITFDCNGHDSATAFLMQGTYPNTGVGAQFIRVQFHNAEILHKIESLAGAGDWECIDISYDDCRWISNVENCRAFWCNTANSGFLVKSPHFLLGKGGRGFHGIKMGALVVLNYYAGSSTYTACSGGLPSTEMMHSLLWLGGTKSNITFIGGQDENLQYTLYNAGSDLSHPITFIGCLIQGKMHLPESCLVSSIGNEYLSNAFTDDTNSSSIVYSWGDRVRTEDVNCPLTVTVNPPRLANFTGGSQIINHLSGGVVQIAIEEDTDDLNPGNQFETIEVITDASRDLTGLAASVVAVKGERRKIANGGGFNLVLKHQDTNSTATNRFICSTGADITLAPNQAADLERNYDNNRWRVYKRN